MRAYTLRTAAKINLHLEILGDRPDGFHELVMVMQSVDLADTLTLRSLPGGGIRLRCDHPLVPQDDTNLAYRAAQLMAQCFPQAHHHQGGVDITLEKAIPVGAGLAGGSGNGAAVLVGINLLWELGLTQGELQEIGAALGSDVPFCIGGGTAIATGRGELLDPLPGGLDLHVVLAKYQSLSVSTPWAYRTYRQAFGHTYLPPGTAWSDRHHALHAGPLVSALSHRQGVALGQALYNDLERVVLPAHPPVAHLRETLAACGGLGTLMSGSGPTVFTLVNSQAEGEALVAAVRDRIPDPDLGLWVTRFQDHGIQLVGP